MGLFRASIARSAALALVAAATASAQTSVGLEAGYADLTNARESARVVFGSTGGATFGLSARRALGRSAFAGLTARFFRKEGQRVFVVQPGDPVFPLGYPLTVKVVPVYATFGWRFWPDAAFVPYVGAGVGGALYRETSTVAGADLDAITRVRPAGLLFAGVERGRGRFRVGLEGSYSAIPGALDAGGVGDVYDESDAGGLALVGRVVYVF